jgi:hypothetical protein
MELSGGTVGPVESPRYPLRTTSTFVFPRRST